jgi:hypothetical protein
MNHNQTALLTRRRIQRHKRNAEQAKTQRDRERYWQERRAMLLAQGELLEQESANDS